MISLPGLENYSDSSVINTKAQTTLREN